MAKVKILYVMGTGHSGSTVLDIVLSSHPELFGCGELMQFSNPRVLRDGSCSCGARIADCEFWSGVYRRWREKSEGAELSVLERLRHRYEHLRHLPRFVLFPPEGEAFESYSRHTRALYEAVLERSARNVVVDSSKVPMRALMLSRMPWADLHILHLVRDGRAVAWSYYKVLLRQQAEGAPVGRVRRLLRIFRYSVEWVGIHLVCEYVLRRCRCRQVRIRYEDFVADPARCVRSIGELLGMDLSSTLSLLEQDGSVPVSHCLAGNRARMTGRLTLRTDTDWEKRMSRFEKVLSGLVTGVLARRYGYCAGGEDDG